MGALFGVKNGVMRGSEIPVSSKPFLIK